MSLLNQLFGTSSTQADIKKITPAEAKENLSKDRSIILLDVREDSEFRNGHIKNAKNISVGSIDASITNQLKNKDTVIYAYCQSGARSARACQKLISLGYTNVYNLGGIASWPYEVVR